MLIDGPSSGVRRCVRNFKDLHLTKYVVPIRVGQRTKALQQAYDKEEINKKFQESNWAKKIEMKKKVHFCNIGTLFVLFVYLCKVAEDG